MNLMHHLRRSAARLVTIILIFALAWYAKRSALPYAGAVGAALMVYGGGKLSMLVWRVVTKVKSTMVGGLTLGKLDGLAQEAMPSSLRGYWEVEKKIYSAFWCALTRRPSPHYRFPWAGRWPVTATQRFVQLALLTATLVAAFATMGLATFPFWWGGAFSAVLFYAFIWSVGEPLVLARSGVELTSTSLHCDVGVRQSMRVPVHAISNVHILTGEAALPAGTWTAIRLGTAPNVLVHLQANTAVSHSWFGFAQPSRPFKRVCALALALNDPEDFVSAMNATHPHEQGP